MKNETKAFVLQAAFAISLAALAMILSGCEYDRDPEQNQDEDVYLGPQRAA